MRTIAACLALISTTSGAHEGHGASLAHLHPDEWMALAALAVALAWIVARGGRR